MRIVVITLAYNPAPMMRASLKRFEETFGIGRDRFEHVFVDQHYPRGRAAILEFLEEQKKHSNVTVLDPGENLGLHRGFNFALDHLHLSENDIVIGYDPDCFPKSPGWGWAMENVLYDKSVAWCSTWTPHTDRETTERGYNDMIIAGFPVRKTNAPVLNSVCGWRADFLLSGGGLFEHHPYYGGLECAMWNRLVKRAQKWVFLKDFHEEPVPDDSLIDTDYRTWKWVTCHGGEEQCEFGAWLDKKGIPRE